MGQTRPSCGGGGVNHNGDCFDNLMCRFDHKLNGFDKVLGAFYRMGTGIEAPVKRVHNDERGAT